MTPDVKYLRGTLDSKFNFNKDITMKIWKAMPNFTCIKAIWKYLTKQACTTLVLSLCILHLDYGNAVLYGLPKKIHKETINSSKHMCQACTAMLKIFQHNTSTHGPTLAPNWTTNPLEDTNTNIQEHTQHGTKIHHRPA